MDGVLIIMALFLFAFTITMIAIFCKYGAVPDTLIISVFGACTGEMSICGWIKSIKERKNENISDFIADDGGEDNL